MNNLYLRAIRATVVGTVAFFAVIFIPAGTLDYWQGWVFVGTLSVSSIARRVASRQSFRAAWLRPKQTDLVPDKGQFRSRFPQSAQGGRDRSGGGFPNAGYEPHPSCGDCPLTAIVRTLSQGGPAVGRPPHGVRRYYVSFTYQAQSWSKPRRVVANVESHPGELYPRIGFIITT